MNTDRKPPAYKFSELCRLLGKSPLYIKNIQRQLKLHAPPTDSYTGAYLAFMEKIVALRTFDVSMTKIRDLFDAEKSVLRLLHIDSMSNSITWYLDACDAESNSDYSPRIKKTRLLLTGCDLGFAVTGGPVQHNLDFGTRDAELFKGTEMGEDVGAALKKYSGRLNDIVTKVKKEKPILEDALKWAQSAT